MPDFDPRYIDVDFQREERFVFGDLGVPKFLMFGMSYEQRFGVLPESVWPKVIEANDAAGAWPWALVTRIYNQKSEGACVSDATAQTHEVIQAKQYGKDKVIHLSAISLYKRVARSPGSGSLLSDNLDEIKGKGILPLDTLENRARFGAHVMDNTGYHSQYPVGWEATAAKFKGIESYIIESLAGLVTALLTGVPVVVGRSGHSIVYCGVVYHKGQIACQYANSWGEWGFGLGDFTYGFGLDTIRMVQASAQWAFAIRSVTAPQ